MTLLDMIKGLGLPSDVKMKGSPFTGHGLTDSEKAVNTQNAKWRKVLKGIVLNELILLILLQRNVLKKDVLPKRSVDVLSMKSCERISKKLAQSQKLFKRVYRKVEKQ